MHMTPVKTAAVNIATAVGCLFGAGDVLAKQPRVAPIATADKPEPGAPVVWAEEVSAALAAKSGGAVPSVDKKQLLRCALNKGDPACQALREQVLTATASGNLVDVYKQILGVTGQTNLRDAAKMASTNGKCFAVHEVAYDGLTFQPGTNMPEPSHNVSPAQLRKVNLVDRACAQQKGYEADITANYTVKSLPEAVGGQMEQIAGRAKDAGLTSYAEQIAAQLAKFRTAVKGK